ETGSRKGEGRYSWPFVLLTPTLALLISLQTVGAQPAVTSLTGGPHAGYVDGNTQPDALFNSPLGLAIGSDPIAGDILYVADCTNNAIRKLELSQNLTITFLTSRISRPVGVVLDRGGNLFVLNRGNGTNGTLLRFNRYGNFLGTNATALTNVYAMALDAQTNVYVTSAPNKVIKITPEGVTSTVAIVTNANTLLQGITVTSGGSLAVCDSGNHGIWQIDPSTGQADKLTGFNGAGDTFGTPDFAQFNQPRGVSAAGGGWLVVTDYGNHRVKTIDSSGNVCSLYGVASSNWTTSV